MQLTAEDYEEQPVIVIAAVYEIEEQALQNVQLYGFQVTGSPKFNQFGRCPREAAL